VPFKPLRLLIAYDSAGKRCGMVVPRMKQLLEERAFEVDVWEIDDQSPDLDDYQGVVIGTPVRGLALRDSGPTAKVAAFIQNTEALEEKKVALFCVFDVRPGTVFDRMKNLLNERGADVVTEYPYWRLQPADGADLLPAECMVRIRTR
jgi:menaquinone-dependent protoporphyrinogen IX oxidase